MGIWNTFVKVWQVRTSVKIQQTIESSYYDAKEKIETQANLKEIIDELNKKNKSWKNSINNHRKKTENE